MLFRETLNGFKEIAPLLADLIPGGVIFFSTNKEEIDWTIKSKSLNIDVFQVGLKIRVGGAAYQSIAEARAVTEKIPRAVYGVRLLMTCIPISNGDSMVGCLGIVFPNLHPIALAFHDFAPIVTDMFPEGAFLYMSDLEKIAYRQASKKFDITDIQVGQPLKQGTVASEAINSQQLAIEELDTSVHGVPTMIMSHPLFDEDNKIVATFGMALPRMTAVNLRQMSNNLSTGLEEISSVIEELAASATEITSNEQNLNSNIFDIYQLSEDINNVLGFIKQIADETKMLGLNAAIEAARAGDAGRGFGVVAQEIRKLSDESKETVQTIRDLTNRIKQKIDETNKNSELTLRSCEEQAAATEEMTASVEEIASMAEELEKIAKIV